MDFFDHCDVGDCLDSASRGDGLEFGLGLGAPLWFKVVKNNHSGRGDFICGSELAAV